MTMRSWALAGCVVSTMVGLSCKKGDHPTTPSNTGAAVPILDPSCPESSTPPNCGPVTPIGTYLRIDASDGPAAAPFSVNVGGLVIAGSGQKYYRLLSLRVADYEVTGQVQASRFLIAFQTTPSNGPGQVVKGSVQSLEGPVQPAPPELPGCTVVYSRPIGGAPQAFRMKFTVTNIFDQATLCQP